MNEIVIDKLLRSRRRTIGLEITREAKLVVRAPRHVSEKDIECLILKKKNWILEKQNISRERIIEYPAKKFVDGENYYYLGDLYCLRLVDGKAISLTDCLEFPKRFLLNPKRYLIRWYKILAYSKIKGLVDVYGLYYASLKISSAKKQLGSCSVRRNLNFSWRLILAPLIVIQYVVAHELAHFEEHNHSKRFWQKVETLYPDYRQARSWLKKNYRLLDI